MANNTYLTIPAKILKTDILSTDVVFRLRDIVWYTDVNGTDVLLTSGDFGTDDVGFGVFEPRTAREEWFFWDTSTVANYSTTGITITARGLARNGTGVSSITRQFSHPSGSPTLLYTNSPDFYETFANLANDETVTGLWTFPNNANYPVIGTTYVAPFSNLQIATKKYVDDTVVFGAPLATTTTVGIVQLATPTQQANGVEVGSTGGKLVVATAYTASSTSGIAKANFGIIADASGRIDQSWLNSARTIGAVYSFTADNAQITTQADSGNDATNKTYVDNAIAAGASLGTSGEAITVGMALYVKASDGKLYKTTTAGDESTFSFMGFALETVGAADLSIRFAGPGVVATGLTGLTAGSYYWLNGANGAISTTPNSTREAKVGQAVTTTTLRVIEPKFARFTTTSFVGVTQTTITTGFYPERVTINAENDSNTDTGGSTSVGVTGGSGGVYDGANTTGALRVISNSWVCRNNATNTVLSQGDITARAQTTLTLNETVHVSGTTTLRILIESL